MAKVKYYYDSENLAYRKIKVKKRKKGFVILFLIVSACLDFFCSIVKHTLLETPKRTARREIANLKLNYAVLDRK
jgi:hypothetical protein